MQSLPNPRFLRFHQAETVVVHQLNNKIMDDGCSIRPPESARVQKSQLPPLQNQNINDNSITDMIIKLNSFDKNCHIQKSCLLTKISGSLNNDNIISKKHIAKTLFSSLTSILNFPTPYSNPKVYFKSVTFPNKDHTSDIYFAYQVLRKLIAHYKYDVPKEIINALIKRLSSASTKDRKLAKITLESLDKKYSDYILTRISIVLIQPPFHGVKEIMNLANNLAKDKEDSEIIRNLFISLKMCHLAPHYFTFHEPLTRLILTLVKKNKKYTNELLVFMLNHWTRNDPNRSVLLMKEAEEICSPEEEIDEIVWQRFSFRASSIYVPLALEGLNFIHKTKDESNKFNTEKLRFVLSDSVKNHWCRAVRERSSVALEEISPSTPKEPLKLPIDKWITIKEMAKKNYPEDNFNSISRRRRQIRSEK